MCEKIALAPRSNFKETRNNLRKVIAANRLITAQAYMPIHVCEQAYIVYSHYIRPKLTCVCVYVRVHVCVLVLDYNVGLIKYSSTYARMHYACMYVFLLRASMAARTSIYTRAFMYV